MTRAYLIRTIRKVCGARREHDHPDCPCGERRSPAAGGGLGGARTQSPCRGRARGRRGAGRIGRRRR